MGKITKLQETRNSFVFVNLLRKNEVEKFLTIQPFSKYV